MVKKNRTADRGADRTAAGAETTVLQPDFSTEAPEGQAPDNGRESPTLAVLQEYFFSMRDFLAIGQEEEAAKQARSFRAIFTSPDMLTQDQRAVLYARYRRAIEQAVPEHCQAMAYCLLQITPKDPKLLPITDMGNAERLVLHHGDDLRFCHPWRQWLVWDGRRWAPDETGEINRRAKDTVRTIYAEASLLEESGKREDLGKWALRSETRGRIEAMITVAESERGIPVKPDELDADPWILNVLNGTLDLRTGELCDHRRADLMTKLVPVTYAPAAACPTWDAFLDRVMAGNARLIEFLQRAAGYSLTGDTSEHCLFILYGTGANGKTTFLTALGDVLGDYGQQTPTDTLLVKRSDGVSEDVARLKGARLVTAAEVEEGRRLAESLVKQLTGGDRIAARFLYSKTFEFIPIFKLWLGTNHKPVIRGMDYAIWRRIRLIPFTVTIPEAEQDRRLSCKLREEFPGILAWMVRGCLGWQRDGLGTPDEVKEATKAYKDEMDVIGQFLEECTYEPAADTPAADAEMVRIRAGELFKAYQGWCEENGERVINLTRFGRRMVERGYQKTSPKETQYVYYLRLGLLR